MSSLLRRRVAGWIAIFAILLNAFAPAVSHALATGETAPWLEVCTDAGVAKAGGVRDQGERPAKQATATQHCPYCAPHGASFAAPPAATSLAVSFDTAAESVAGTALSGTHSFYWGSARSRAPPAL